MRLHAWPRPSKKFRESRKCRPCTALLRQEWLAPTRRTVFPAKTSERKRGQSLKFLLAFAPWQRRVTKTGRDIAVLVCCSGRKDDAHRLLNTLKDTRRHIRLMAFGGAIDHTDLAALAAQVLAHLLESRTIQ